MSKYDPIMKALSHLDKSSRMLASKSMDDDIWACIDECRHILRDAYACMDMIRKESEALNAKDVKEKVEISRSLKQYPSLEWNPDVSTISPVVVGTIVTASNFVKLIKEGHAIRHMQHWCPTLTEDDVNQCVAWSKENE